MKSTNYKFPKKTVRDISINNKRILLRADFNVPLSNSGQISSDYRISQTIPTIKYLLERNCDIVILSHLGRPEGKVNLEFSLKPVATVLEELLGKPVEFIEDCVNDQVRQNLKRQQHGHVRLLENVRFHPGEEANGPEFAELLKRVIRPDYVVQDGFGVVHRAHASTAGISHIVPSVAGLLLEKEVQIISSAMSSPHKPLVAVLGGAKIADKLPLIEAFIEKAEVILIGGAMANNFMAFNGIDVGKSLVDEEGMKDVENIIKKAKTNQLILPIDVAVSKTRDESAKRRDCGLNEIEREEMILDIGFETMRQFSNHLKNAGTIVWNGTLGMAENPKFAQGSSVVAEAISKEYPDATSIIGGGDTADFVLDWQKQHKNAQFSHISTGGGASLELMSGQKLPGVEALLDN